MASKPPNDIIRLAQQFDAALKRNDQRALKRLIAAYQNVYARLQDKINLLIDAIGTEAPTPGQLVRMARYKALIRQTEAELTDYQVILRNEIAVVSREAITISGRDSARMLQAMGIRGGFNRLPTEAIKTLLGFLDEEGPLYARLNQLAGVNAKKVADAIVDGVSLGQNPRVVAGAIRDSLGGGLTDALRMTRTVQLYSYREASRANYLANSDVVYGWVWFAALDDRTCASCVAMHGTEHGLDETLDDHHNGRCYPADTLVSGDSIEAFISRDYDGDMLTFKTASGEFFTVTPNHPILTTRGWVEAQFIQFGDYVARNTGLQRTTTSIDPNKDHGITRIQDIPRALRMDAFGSVPGATKYFNRQSFNSNIDVVISDSFLWDDDLFILPKPSTQKLLGSRLLAIDLPGIGAQGFLALGNYTPPASLLSRQHNFLAMLGRIFGYHQTVCISRSTNIDSASVKSADNYRAADPKIFSEFVLRFPGQVSPDQIIDINIVRFHGNVYNLQTKEGWYNASNIITHNCAMIPLVNGFDNPIEQTGEQWFSEQSEAKQAGIMGKEKYEAYKGGAFEFSELTTTHADDVYGSMRTETPLWMLLGAEPPIRTR